MTLKSYKNFLHERKKNEKTVFNHYFAQPKLNT